MSTTWFPMKKKKTSSDKNYYTPFKVRCPICTGRGYVRDKHTKEERPCLGCSGKGELKRKCTI